MCDSGESILPSPPLPAAQQSWALFLDVDGTLIELAPSPGDVLVPPALTELLVALREQLNGAIALISGRSIATLDQLFFPLSLPAAGLHGFERRNASGAFHRATLDSSSLAEMRGAVHQLAETLPGLLVEDKQFAVALHYGRIQAQKSELYEATHAIAQRTGFEVQPGRLVFELKPPSVNKGLALAAFSAEEPFASRLPVFLGDDLTDEYALRMTRDLGGMAIKVGEQSVDGAQFALDDPVAVTGWLQQWKSRMTR